METSMTDLDDPFAVKRASQANRKTRLAQRRTLRRSESSNDDEEKAPQ
jgi:hypothetical protein